MTARRPPILGGGALSFIALLGLLGCTGDGDNAGSTANPTPPSSAVPAGTSVAPDYVLPDSCSDLLHLTSIDAAIGTALVGVTTLTVGVPKPAIGRTGRVTCDFGIIPATDTEGASNPALELSVFTYTDEGSAADRVRAIVDAQRSQGSRTEELVAAGIPAVLLTGTAEATVLTAVAARTYSLTLSPGIVDPGATATVLQQLMGDVLAADAADDLTAGPGGTAATTSPSTGGSTGTSDPTG